MHPLPLHRDQDDECGDTASITYESDPESILSCGDTNIVQIIQPSVLENRMNPDTKQSNLGDQMLIVNNQSISNASELTDPGFDGPGEDESLDLLQQNESISHQSSKSAGSAVNRNNEGKHQKQQNILAPSKSELNHIVLGTQMQRANSRDMRCELDRIECKIKAAIHANQRIRSNWVELETVLREIHSGRAVPRDLDVTVVHVESFCEPMSELEISYENILGKSCLDVTVDQRVEELENENYLLRRKILSMDEELTQVNETKAQNEKDHKEVVEKLKNEARETKKLVRRLQKKKLANMEINFIASLNLLEAKMSEEINNGDELEERLAAMKAERDTARELNLPLFNDLKRLYSIKRTLELKVHDLLDSEKELMQKEKIANENASRLSNDVSFAHDEISRLTLEMASLTKQKDVQINDLDTMVKRLCEESAQKSQEYQDLLTRYNDTVMEKEALGATIQQLQEENAQLRKKSKELELENPSYKEKCLSHHSEEDDLR